MLFDKPLRIFIAVGALALLGACGGGGEKASDKRADGSSSEAETSPYKGESRHLVDEKVEPATATEGVMILPAFGKDGDGVELAVGRGERFFVQVYAEYGDPYQINTAEFALVLPGGVRSLHVDDAIDHALSMGTPDNDYVMAYPCAPPGRYALIKVECETGDDFQGGEIRVKAGVNREGKAFLGFASCPDPMPARVPASGGSVRLRLK